MIILSRKKKEISAENQVSGLILENPYFLLMLEHFGIGLGIHEKTVEEVCLEHTIRPGLFIMVANLFNGVFAFPSGEADTEDIPQIIHYLKSCHRYYQEEQLPRIRENMHLLTECNDHPEMILAEKFFDEYYREVTEHLAYENEVAFPLIQALCDQANEYGPVTRQNIHFVREYKEHHNDIEEKLEDLRNLLIRYLPQKDDQPVRRRLLFSLFEFEHDLRIHSSIEDLILIPLAEQLETGLNAGT